eukprot:707180-Prymnesium_polylepis.1
MHEAAPATVSCLASRVACSVSLHKWASSEGLLKSIQEADRGRPIAAPGAMEYVPASRMAEVAAVSTIH